MLALAAESLGGVRRLVQRGVGSEQELVSQAITGDPRAWEALVQHLTPTIHNQVALVLLAKRGSRRVAAQDVLDYRQDVFVLLLEQNYRILRSWQPDRGASLTTFAGLVARRLTLSALRTGKRGAWLEDPTDDGSLDSGWVAPDPSPEAVVLDRRTLDALFDRLHETLSPQRMALFLALHRDERPIDEVASEFGLTTNAIYTWQSRLRQTLDRLVSEVRGVEVVRE